MMKNVRQNKSISANGHHLLLTFKLNTNLQTLNNNIASAEKPPIFTACKSYKKTVTTHKN